MAEISYKNKFFNFKEEGAGKLPINLIIKWHALYYHCFNAYFLEIIKFECIIRTT
jgi:hypothetical protein